MHEQREVRDERLGQHVLAIAAVRLPVHEQRTVALSIVDDRHRGVDAVSERTHRDVCKLLPQSAIMPRLQDAARLPADLRVHEPRIPVTADGGYDGERDGDEHEHDTPPRPRGTRYSERERQTR